MILVTGATGQLGYDVMRELRSRNIPCFGVGSTEFDLRKREDVFAFVQKVNPEAIIHCAAYTQVDKAEDESELCREVNVHGTSSLVQVSKELEAKFLYISTDYVFDGVGDSAYVIDSPTNPQNVYGLSKRDGEQEVIKYLEDYFILRVSWIYGRQGNNFVKTMLRLGKEQESLRVVDDQIGSPSYTVDLANLMCDMVQTERYGVYHGTNEGFCSWAEFATEIMKQAGLHCDIKPISSEEYSTKGKRPKNSRLDKSCLEQEGFGRLPHWRDGLRRYLEKE